MREAVGGGAETLVAILALVVSLAGVYATVDAQRILAGEFFTAEFTFEMFL